MSAIWRSVILSPLGTPFTYWLIVSSSERSPSSAAWRSRVAVKVLVRLPILWCTSGVIGSPEARSATPRARTHVYLEVCPAATTPGASLSLKDFSNAASRSALVACSPPPLVWVPAAESPLLHYPRHIRSPAGAPTRLGEVPPATSPGAYSGRTNVTPLRFRNAASAKFTTLAE
jgi:hypothetical protein